MITVAQKMKISQGGKTSTEEYLSGIYSAMRNNLKDENKSSFDWTSAQILQSFLMQLKQIQNKLASGDTIEQAIQGLKQESLFKTLFIIKPELFTSGFLIQRGKDNAETGRLLEIGISQMVKSFGTLALMTKYGQVINNQSYNKYEQYLDIITGSSHITNVGGANVNLREIADENIKNIFIEYYNQTREAMHNYLKPSEEFSGYINYLPAVQGKIDVNGLNGELQLNIDTEIDGGIISALQDATFTLKNYASLEFILLSVVIIIITPGIES